MSGTHRLHYLQYHPNHIQFCYTILNTFFLPQENGSHYDCEYVELNNSRYGIVVSAENAFSFNASYYTQEELEKKTHNYELIESDSVVFCVDYALNGIGSNSCGPVVLEQYRFDDVLFRFQFTLVPYVKG